MDSAFDISGHQDRESGSKFDGSFGGMNLVACSVEIEVADEGRKVVSLEIPNLNTTIISNTCEYRRGLRTPTNIVNLFLKLVFVLFCARFVRRFGVTLVSANELLGA